MSDPDVRNPRFALFHIGAPKTATTTLQGWLRNNRKKLSNSGVGVYPPRRVRQHKYLGEFQDYFRGKIDRPQTASFMSLFDDEEHLKVVLSEEALTNDFLPGAKNAQPGFSVVHRTIEFLRGLDIPELHILLTVRRQDKFLKSAYSHQVRRTALAMTFDEWVKSDVKLPDMSWLKVVDALDAAFGAKKVTVVPFEMLEKASDRDFYLRCVAPLSVSLENHEEPKKVNVNSSLAQDTLEISQILNRLDVKDRTELERRRKLINTVNSFVLDNGGQAYQVDLSEVTQQCRAMYRQENAELVARKFPDLKTSFAFAED